jgi:hypothetical protein
MGKNIKTLEERIRELPPDLLQEVEDFTQSLLEKRSRKLRGNLRLDWRGALRDLRDQYTSVDLQHKLLEKRSTSP